MSSRILKLLCAVSFVMLLGARSAQANPQKPESYPSLRFKCIFQDGGGTAHFCSTTDKRFWCSGVGECSGTLNAVMGDVVSWTGDCGERLEGKIREKLTQIVFNCGAAEAFGGVRTLPHQLNIDFGVWLPTPSGKSGPAAVGAPNDFWNAPAVPWNNDHTEGGLLSATRAPSPIKIRMVNLGGGWGFSGALPLKDVMLDSFNYPQNNQGGNSEVILSQVPRGTYDLYLYGRGTDPFYYGDYSVSVGARTYGRKATSNSLAAVSNLEWKEGDQYVRFDGIEIDSEESISILIRPGGEVSAQGRTVRDAMIAGLQLVPVKD